MTLPRAFRLRTGLVSDPSYNEHQPQDWHPERPARLDAVLRGIARAVPDDALRRIAPRPAREEDLRLCHAPKYLDLVRREVAAGGGTLSTGDTGISARSYDVALLAAGGVLAAVDAVFAGDVKNAFCAVRPPGHHAGAAQGMGFCIFNHAAIAARYAQKHHQVQRVAIIDWDVHHGNGTQDIFYSDPSVFYFSTHEWPLYPGTGKPEETGREMGRERTMNRIFPAGTGGEPVRAAFLHDLVPAMDRFQPQFVLVSAGFDAREEDPLANLRLTDRDFAELTDIVMGIAERYADGRLVSILEGGYGLAGLASAAGEHVRVLAGGAPA